MHELGIPWRLNGVEQLSLGSTTIEPAFWGLQATTTEACVP